MWIVTPFQRAQLRVNRPRTLLKYSLRNRVPQQMNIMRRLTELNDISCLDNPRMTHNSFDRLCHILHEMGGLRDSKHVSVHEQVTMFLSVPAHHKKNRTVKYDFICSGQTVSRHFHKVLNVVLRLHPLLLAKPTPVPSNSNCSRWRWFEGCLGALNGTYIDVRVPTNDKARYRTRKGSIAVNVLGVCDRDLNFIYILSGWEGSATNSRVLRDAMNRNNSLKFQEVCEMDVEVVAGVRRGAGRKGGKLSHRIWSVIEEESLLVALKEIARNSGLKSDPHISSKIHVWKKTYSCLLGMLSKSGFGWDEPAYMVDPFAHTLRHKSFLYFSSWSDVFGKDCANGVVSLTINDSRGPVRPEHVTVTPECYVPSPDPNIYGDDHEFMAVFANKKPNNSNEQSKVNKGSLKKQKVEQTNLDTKFDEKIDSSVNTQNTQLSELSHRFGMEYKESKTQKSVWDAIDVIPGLMINDKCMIAKKLVNNKMTWSYFSVRLKAQVSTW
ncbi:UNVERIFIED_CONTAM: hypothetical protein Sradi_3662300 [Sesamum radiatum]|uniref:Myb/SANT-like domain-containing protein n=1 Tax=Sesamum radiatum TaxID=300843 RepID=A0AAW2QIJ1_SESRA